MGIPVDDSEIQSDIAKFSDLIPNFAKSYAMWRENYEVHGPFGQAMLDGRRDFRFSRIIDAEYDAMVHQHVESPLAYVVIHIEDRVAYFEALYAAYEWNFDVAVGRLNL